jgi:chromosomal replication initiator protein
MGNSHLWDSILLSVEKKVNHASFLTWFKPIIFLNITSSQLIIKVPDQVFGDWLLNNYKDVIEEALIEVNLPGREIIFQLSIEINDSQDITHNLDVFGKNENKLTERASKSSLSISSLDNSIKPVILQSVNYEPFELSLNSKYKFETFVVGSSNQFAHAAARAVAEAPSKTYNPLYIYGGVGLGKTHLMHAIGHQIYEKNRQLKLCYISVERFMNELINAIRYDQTLNFREKYRTIDVLLIDDIQFIAGKERTQEEFFHTFNALYDRQKQIVISSDCPPREIPTLEERLHSRFEWGLIADIQPPDLETKVAIIRKKAEIEKLNLPNDVVLLIASKVKSNIRELEGSLVRLMALSSIRGEAINLNLANEALKNIFSNEDQLITIESIQKVIADYYCLRIADLKSKSNARNITLPRQIAMYICKILTKASLPIIGREFGGKHHTTVLHSINKINDLYEQGGSFQRLINSLIASCKLT